MACLRIKFMTININNNFKKLELINPHRMHNTSILEEVNLLRETKFLRG